MIEFSNSGLYIESQTSIEAKIVAIDAIITSLLSAAASSAGTSHLSEYSLNDGQVLIKSSLRGSTAIMQAIKDFEALKIFYMNKINPRVVRLVDEKNFIGRTNLR